MLIFEPFVIVWWFIRALMIKCLGSKAGSVGLLVVISLWARVQMPTEWRVVLASRECRDLLVFSFKKLNLSKGNSSMIFCPHPGEL